MKNKQSNRFYFFILIFVFCILHFAFCTASFAVDDTSSGVVVEEENEGMSTSDTTGADETETTQGFALVPGGLRMIIMGKMKPEPGVKAYRIFRKEGSSTPQKIGEIPSWKRNPELLIESLGKENFDAIAKKFDVTTPGELLHKSEDNMMVLVALMSLFPKYPKMAGIMENTLFFEDANIKKDVAYEYSIKKVNMSDIETDLVEMRPNTAKGGDVWSPPSPANIKVKEGDKQVILTWIKGQGGDLAESDAGYNIYRKQKNEDFQIVGYAIPTTSEEQSYLDKELENGVEYTYQLAALNLVGVESKKSAEYKATPHDLTPPFLITDIEAKLENNDKVIVTWATCTAIDFSYYNIYRTDDIDKDYIKLNKEKTKSTKYVDKKFELDGKTYFYAITAMDTSNNESKKGTPQYVTLPDLEPPLPPASFTYTFNKETKSAKIKWEHSPSKDFTIYSIFKGTSKTNLQMVDTVKATVNEYEDSFVKQGVKYYYSVQAQDFSANLSNTKEVLEVKVPDITPPVMPYGFDIIFKKGEKGLHLKWADIKTKDFKGYNIYRAREENGEYKKIAAATTTQYFDKPIEPGTTYWYKLSQIDKSGNESQLLGPKSGTVKDSVPPAVPLNIKAELKKEGILTTWQPNTEKDIGGYNVYLVDEFRFTERKITDVPVKAAEFLIKYTDIGKEGKFGIKVTAVDTSENESAKSNLVSPSMGKGK